MELVNLRDVPATYATTWLFVANTEGVDRIQINDEFQEVGTLEIFAVENIALSPIPGASRILFRRGEHASPVELHRGGGVFAPLKAEVKPAPVTEPEPVVVKRGPGRPRKQPVEAIAFDV